MLDNQAPRLYDLAKMREQEIVRRAEMARVIESRRESYIAGALQHLLRVAKDALAPKSVEMPRFRAVDGDVPA